MELTLIAEVLAGETMVTPGGAVDTETACCLDAFTWDGWLEQLRDAKAAAAAVELTGAPQRPSGALAR